jgi:serine protease AprX
VSISALDYSSEPIHAPLVWEQGFVGTNVGIAVIDSGVQPVSDLHATPANVLPRNQPTPLKFAPVAHEDAPGMNGRIVYSKNFVPGETDAMDHYGHGTHVAGLIAGNGSQSRGAGYIHTFYGQAPNANIINLRALDDTGAGTDSTVIAAIETAIALRSTYNIRIINLSLGRPIYESYTRDPLCQAVEQAWKAGIVVVVAAGNDGRNLNLNPEGYGTINSPGNDPYVITVGAVRSMQTPAPADDLIASYSSKGPSFIDHVAKPDIVAPGNLVVSLQFANDLLVRQNPSFVTLRSFYQRNAARTTSPVYFPLSGTSMSAAVASGAVADLLQAVPELNPDQVKALLMMTANRGYFPDHSRVVAEGVVYEANYDVFTVGAGYLDVDSAVNFALSSSVPEIPAGTAKSPSAVYDELSGDTSLVIDETALWGKSDQWSASSVYGSNAFVPSVDGSTALWGNTALWGKDDLNAFSALWGKTALWGKGSPDAATALWGKDGTDASSSVLWGKSGSGERSVPLE